MMKTGNFPCSQQGILLAENREFCLTKNRMEIQTDKYELWAFREGYTVQELDHILKE